HAVVVFLGPLGMQFAPAGDASWHCCVFHNQPATTPPSRAVFPGQSAFLARLGATRGGSSGCFGYTGGQGASSSPLARSRPFISRSGSSDCGSPFMPSHGSPTVSSLADSDAIVNWSGWMSSISAQATGVETCAPGRARTDQAPNTVLCGAF